MTFNEARAALAIGCKVYMPHWAVTRYVFAMDEQFVHYLNNNGEARSAETPANHITSTDWEIYHENQGSNTSPKDRV